MLGTPDAPSAEALGDEDSPECTSAEVHVAAEEPSDSEGGGNPKGSSRRSLGPSIRVGVGTWSRTSATPRAAGTKPIDARLLC